jgi:hypothetical protein
MSFWSRIAYFTPVRPIMRAKDSVVGLRQVLSETGQRMRSQLPAQRPEAGYPEDDARSIEDSKERFEAMYALHGWNEEDLAKQVLALKKSRLTALIMSVVSLAAVLVALFSLPVYAFLVVLPLGGCLGALGAAKAFQFALYEAQIERRELISAREFASAPDLWHRMIG